MTEVIFSVFLLLKCTVAILLQQVYYPTAVGPVLLMSDMCSAFFYILDQFGFIYEYFGY